MLIVVPYCTISLTGYCAIMRETLPYLYVLDRFLYIFFDSIQSQKNGLTKKKSKKWFCFPNGFSSCRISSCHILMRWYCQKLLLLRTFIAWRSRCNFWNHTPAWHMYYHHHIWSQYVKINRGEPLGALQRKSKKMKRSLLMVIWRFLLWKDLSIIYSVRQDFFSKR